MPGHMLLGKSHLANVGGGQEAGTAQVNASFQGGLDDKSSCKQHAEQVMLHCPVCSGAATCLQQAPSALPSSAGRRNEHMRGGEMPLHMGQ